MDSTVHLFDFLIGQIARTLASQHSVPVFHRHSPFWPKSPKKAVRAAFQNGPPARRLLNGAAFSNIAIGVAINAAGAHSCRTESTVYLLDFLFGQITRTLAEQYSVLVVHNSGLLSLISRPSWGSHTQQEFLALQR